MADPVPSACPFDGYVAPILEKGDEANDGTDTYRVICPVCGIHTADQKTKIIACNLWNARSP